MEDRPPEVLVVEEDSPPESRPVEDKPPDRELEGRFVDMEDAPVPELVARSPGRPPNENPPEAERLILPQQPKRPKQPPALAAAPTLEALLAALVQPLAPLVRPAPSALWQGEAGQPLAAALAPPAAA